MKPESNKKTPLINIDYQKLSECISDGIWECNLAEGIITFKCINVNSFDIENMSISTTTLKSNIHPIDYSQTISAYNDIIDGKINKLYSEYRVLNKFNEYCWIQVEAYVSEYNHNHKPAFLQGIFREINERKAQEIRIQNQHKNLEVRARLFNIARNNNLDIHAKFQQIVQLLPNYLEFNQYSGACITHNNRQYFSPGFDKTANKISSPLIVNNQNTGSVDFCYKQWDQLYSPIFFEEDKILLSTASISISSIIEKEHTRMQLSEALQRKSITLSNIDELIIDFNEQGKISFINNAIENILGYSPSELNGKSLNDLFHSGEQKIQHKIEELRHKKIINEEGIIYSKNNSPKQIKIQFIAFVPENTFKGGTIIIKDITNIKLLEIDNNNLHQQLNSILDVSPNAIIITDKNGNIESSSRMAHLFFETTPEVIAPDKSFIDLVMLFTNTEPEIFINHKTQTFPYKKSYEIKNTQQQTRYIELHINKTHNTENENFIFFFRDVTLRKKAQERNIELEERYKHLVETINEIIYEIDPDGHIKYVSPAVEQMGYIQHEIIGRNFLDFCGKHRTTLNKNLIRLKKGEKMTSEYDILTKDNQTRWLRFSTKGVFDERGKFVCGTGTLTDITKLKNNEHELRTNENLYKSILDLQPEATILCGANGVIKHLSKSCREMLGYTESEDFSQNDIFTLIDQEDSDKLREFFTNAILERNTPATLTGICADQSRIKMKVEAKLIELSDSKTTFNILISAKED